MRYGLDILMLVLLVGEMAFAAMSRRLEAGGGMSRGLFGAC